MKDERRHKYREVSKLPQKAIKDELLFNKTDGCFYLGVEVPEIKEKEGDSANSLEKASV